MGHDQRNTGESTKHRTALYAGNISLLLVLLYMASSFSRAYVDIKVWDAFPMISTIALRGLTSRPAPLFPVCESNSPLAIAAGGYFIWSIREYIDIDVAFFNSRKLRVFAHLVLPRMPPTHQDGT